MSRIKRRDPLSPKKKGIEKKRKKNYKILHTKKHISSPYERETFLNSPRLGDN